MKIAVIGSGISGLSASYFLSKKHHVDLFEKEDRFGGHSYTIDVFENKKRIPVDIGFIVFNHLTYPNLINFFNEIDIEIEKSDISFSVSVEGTNFEYCGKGLKGIFANKSNFLNIKFIRMFLEILKFYKLCDKISNIDQVITLNEFLKKNKYTFKIIKFRNSGITGIFFGSYSKINFNKKIFPTEDFQKFCESARENLLIQQLNNRIDVKFKISRFFKNKFPYKFSIKSKKKNLV